MRAIATDRWTVRVCLSTHSRVWSGLVFWPITALGLHGRALSWLVRFRPVAGT